MRLLFIPLLVSFTFLAAHATSAETSQTTQTEQSRNPGPVPYRVQKPPLDTPWTYTVGTNPWPQHPRPQLRRDDAWQNLNGIWTYQPAASASASAAPATPPATPPAGELEREVLVPSCIESGLSGIQARNVTRMWFARKFSVPASWEGRSVVVHFDAVDYEATVFVNGGEVGSHVGGYDRFTVDVTRSVEFGGENDLLVFVHDPTDMPPYVNPVGKQKSTPSHIWYTPCSGIWQTVWMESVPSNHITRLDISGDMNGTVTMTAHGSTNQSTPVEVSVLGPNGGVLATASSLSDGPFSFAVPSPILWSPSSPALYSVRVKMGDDEVSSYTGFRSISMGVVEGVKRPMLNGEFVFLLGTLDQGYWPDGIYTPPSHEAMRYDLQVLKELGFNMLRKHIKVEPDLFYEACDRMGIMVVQDMPSLPDDTERRPPDAMQQDEFQRQLEAMVDNHKSHPSIVAWVLFNEGWGQLRHPPWFEARLTPVVRALDPTRLINAVSGWFDHGFGDFSDNHHYPTPQCGTPFATPPSSAYDARRIGFQGEFGGIGLNVSIEHLWNVPEAIATINQTYELAADRAAYNARSRELFGMLRSQVEQYACSGGVWTQTSDVEGEVNGLLTYDRRLLRPEVAQWKEDTRSVYEAAAARGGWGGGDGLRGGVRHQQPLG
ncbi:glycoside hydrolase family 2 protein [Sodiomyces alkalinus F11]|uniref:Glycoside hydrolase family 2 protein n=1 Tax=Sodiomyces alkalinus (strain CBS 110278 / VKM F-3762 / F11) TaxID=1314773 RepID=A0A3N2Q2N9_SODAK|nr:glycoside hydrolase family 2 protein [Sodiomyces alkalinus F11]ROT41031.1 glycoside hydrolase family 2 protein [Sodiomyces alkalinus F11]